MLGSLSIASRPAAVITGKVAQATTVAGIAFMLSRFANMFYGPLMAGFTGDSANLRTLFQQTQLVVVGSSLGSLASFLLLPNFVNLFRVTVEKLHELGLKSMLRPRVLGPLLLEFRHRYPMGVQPGQLHGIPKDFLLFNVFATAVWTVGGLSAIYCSVSIREFKNTALLLSGLVNSFAAIAFSIWVDPTAALITDDVVNGRRQKEQVFSTAAHLGLGNFVGGMLGLLTMQASIWIIGLATRAIGTQGSIAAGSLLPIVILNIFLTMCSSTTYASRVSAVVTREIASALAIYNFFFLVTRLAQQVYAPLLGSMSDHLQKTHQLDRLEMNFRCIIAGASLGALLGLLLLPTFVEVINQAVRQLLKHKSIPLIIWRCLNPRHWTTILSCLRAPSLLGVRTSDLRSIPKFFLLGNILVLSIHTMGLFAAVCAGAYLRSTNESAAAAAVLLSSVVNGVATITLSLVVDPTTSRMTDQCKAGKLPLMHIKAAALFLLVGMLVGTLLAQVFFTPARLLIQACALEVAKLLHNSSPI